MSIEGFETSDMPADYSGVAAEMEQIVEHTLLINGHDVRSASRFVTQSLLKVLAEARFLNDSYTEAGLIEHLHSGSMIRLAPDEELISTA